MVATPRPHRVIRIRVAQRRNKTDTALPDPVRVHSVSIWDRSHAVDSFRRAQAHQLFGPTMNEAEVLGQVNDGPSGTGGDLNVSRCGTHHVDEAGDLNLQRVRPFNVIHDGPPLLDCAQ